MNTEQTELNRILEIIEKIAADSDYIYRGEPECYPKVSSNLYRELEEANLLHLDIKDVQKAELEDAKGSIKKTDEFEILTEIQHFGGKTNLLDFTSDYRVALFFACDRFPFKDGRVILQDKNGTIKGWIKKPRNLVQGSRPNVQKSIFVQPPKGFIEPDENIVIPKALKQPILKYLEDEFQISTERIYPDLHGFVSRQKTRLGTYKELGKGTACQQNGNQADNSVEKNKHYEKAIKHFTKATQQMPGNVLAYNARGLAYLSKDDPDNSLADFNKAIELDRWSKEAYKGRSAVYRDKGDFDNAIDDAVKLVQLDPSDTAAHCALYLAYWGKGDIENAIASLDEAIRLKPDQPLSYFSRGDTYFAKGDFDNAIKDYNKAIQLNPECIEAYGNRGNAYLEKGQVDIAINDYNRALQLNPECIKSYINRGNAYMHKQEIDLAIGDYNKAIRLNPRLAESYFNRGVAYCQKGKFDLAIGDYNKVTQMDPSFVRAYYCRAFVWLHLHEWEKAKSDLITTKGMGTDIVALFRNLHSSVADFEQKHNVKLPEDIAAMLTPP